MKNIKSFLDGGKFQKKCNNYFLKSIDHEMYVQKIKKSTLNQFDDKRCYMNTIKSKLGSDGII